MKNKDDIFIGIMLAIYGAVIAMLAAMMIAQMFKANERAESAMNAAHYERVYLAGGVK